MSSLVYKMTKKKNKTKFNYMVMTVGTWFGFFNENIYKWQNKTTYYLAKKCIIRRIEIETYNNNKNKWLKQMFSCLDK